MDIPLDKLGAFPILQFAAAVLVLALGAFGMWRAMMSKGAAQPALAGDDASALRAKLGNELLRRDLEQIFAAHRVSIENRLSSFESSIHTKIDRLSEERREAFSGLEERVRDLELSEVRHSREGR